MGAGSRAQWKQFTALGLLIQNSAFNVLARMPGACSHPLVGLDGSLKPGLHNSKVGKADFLV